MSLWAAFRLRRGCTMMSRTSPLRKAAARTVETLQVAIVDALDAVTPDECENYFTNSGYEPV